MRENEGNSLQTLNSLNSSIHRKYHSLPFSLQYYSSLCLQYKNAVLQRGKTPTFCFEKTLEFFVVGMTLLLSNLLPRITMSLLLLFSNLLLCWIPLTFIWNDKSKAHKWSLEIDQMNLNVVASGLIDDACSSKLWQRLPFYTRNT